MKNIGDPDLFKILAQTEDSTKIEITSAMDVRVGCVIKTTTHHKLENGSTQPTESLVFVPGVSIRRDEARGAYKLYRS